MSRIGQLAETIINNEELIVDWQIHDIFSLRSGYYRSHDFNFSDVRWNIKYGAECERAVKSGNVNLWLCKSTGPSKVVDVTFGARGCNGIEMKKRTEHVFRNGESYYGLVPFCARSDLRNSRLLQDNKVIISCILKINFKDVCTQTDCCSEIEDLTTKEKQSLEKRGGEKALEDFGKLLASGEKSDVTVQVGDVEFKVHSNILFARCPALSISLQHECKEKASHRIVIEDFDPDVFKDFLGYIYTGSVRSLTEKNVFSIYRIADKYLADDLKQQCLEHIQVTLSVQTFCDTMKLALTHGERGLLQRAIDFSVKNIKEIVCRVEWQNFLREYPTEANEIFIKSLGPPSNSQ